MKLERICSCQDEHETSTTSFSILFGTMQSLISLQLYTPCPCHVSPQQSSLRYHPPCAWRIGFPCLSFTYSTITNLNLHNPFQLVPLHSMFFLLFLIKYHFSHGIFAFPLSTSTCHCPSSC